MLGNMVALFDLIALECDTGGFGVEGFHRTGRP